MVFSRPIVLSSIASSVLIDNFYFYFIVMQTRTTTKSIYDYISTMEIINLLWTFCYWHVMNPLRFRVVIFHYFSSYFPKNRGGTCSVHTLYFSTIVFIGFSIFKRLRYAFLFRSNVMYVTSSQYDSQ